MSATYSPEQQFNDPYCPPTSVALGYVGIACALSFTSLGSAYGTFKSAIGLFKVCSEHPELFYRSMMPVIMAGIVGIYGLVAAIISSTNIHYPFSQFKSYAIFSGGLCVGLAGLASGCAIGIAGDVSCRAMSSHPELFMGAMLILIFGEVLGLYGFIISMILSGKSVLACGARP
ncbi:V-type ATPase, C subunit family protein [Trichomonas vaginalis G3]|uniref:V-type proton ATPase proteolipid subunit n=1 Tax=Trichomonas vaginalis (strain ATCC PRA-98 / G3) TaxID=412133 RepID=A2DM06_TRIV3|nr:ATP hydrolysis coupled proton transport [Trichomonas vaginalis G3]EAY18609.1 V-type ATPase, C subunit family protein [Trichomonas vaginalis G3]KAI5491645.1 ATP hydrolysis coupled proton transport [Trichomonas vaginalis G3]|eukprot:XP_001579595.1 V-type ATPase, C subunit family protein [Trichomonas vaginalis G3]